MSEFGSKILRGEKPSEDDWNQYLRDAHLEAPSMTPAAYAPYKTKNGQTSYEILANTIEDLQSASATVLDLACGDGYLLQFLLSKLGASGSVVGVDMSAGELKVASATHRENPKVKLYQAQAQALPLAKDSIDAIVCHMAFMLMLPVEPVVLEICRVLKEGGLFSAVINSPREGAGFSSELQKVTSQFIESRLPGFRAAPTGDSRVKSEAGLKELFNKASGFNDSIEIFDFSILISTGPQGVWNLMKDMYFVSMLTKADKLDLELDLKSLAAGKANAGGVVEFEIQMRRFTARKLTV